MDFYYDETDGKIKYTVDLTHLFAEETKELQLVLSLVDVNITKDDFNETCDDIEKIINDSYKNNSTDIEDLSDVLYLLDKKIEQLFTSKNNVIKFNRLCELRKKTKKYANKKFREGHDWIYQECIKNGQMESKIKYPDEKPRDFLMVEEFAYQYDSLLKYYWYPGLEKLKEIINKYELDK
jgi:hypothetical protein